MGKAIGVEEIPFINCWELGGKVESMKAQNRIKGTCMTNELRMGM